jgi:hypothetical protein
MFDASKSAVSNPHGLLTLLRNEHQRMDWMLSLYRQQASIGLDPQERKRLIERIDRHLRALVVITQSMLYPLVKPEMQPHSFSTLQRDHSSLHERLVAISQLEPDTLAMDTQMDELALHVRAHIASVERRAFPLAQSLDSPMLGQSAAQLREGLLSMSPA